MLIPEPDVMITPDHERGPLRPNLREKYSRSGDPRQSWLWHSLMRFGGKAAGSMFRVPEKGIGKRTQKDLHFYHSVLACILPDVIKYR